MFEEITSPEISVDKPAGGPRA